MHLAIEITLNIIWIALICLICAVAGFLVRSLLISRLKSRVFDLEKQTLQNDAEILALQKENAQLQDQLKNTQVPVIPITQKDNPEKLPDTNSRKKLLEKAPAKQQS